MCLHPDVMEALLKHEAPSTINAIYRAAYAEKHGEAAGAAATEVRSCPASEQAPAVAPKVKPATLRKRKSRAMAKALKGQIEMFAEGVTSSVTGVTSARDIQSTPPPQVSPLREISNPLSSPTEVGGGGDAREAPLVLVTQEAFAIADEIGVIVGLDPEFIPPGWCGAAMQVQAWLAHWTRDEIIAGVRAGMASKRDGPPESPNYFTKPIARVHLRLVAPVPKTPEVAHDHVVNSKPATGWQGARDNWRAARAELHDAVVGFSARGG